MTNDRADVYSDALLEAHEAEIERLEALKEQRAPTLAMVDKYRSLVQDRNDLAASSQDASRLMLRGQKGEKRDPTRLLREEKMRKRIAKDLPKVESDLRQILEEWEEEYGRPFLVHGERYLDELEATSQKPSSQGSVRSKTPSIPPRSKTPSSVPPSTVRPKSAAAAAPTTAIKTQTLRGLPRSKTPTASRNPLASSVMGPPLSHSSSNSSFAASVGPGSLRSPSKIPGRQPLGSVLQASNSTARRPPPGPLGHCRTESDSSALSSTLRSRMAPPPRPMSRDFFSPPETPCPINNADMSFERSGSIIRRMSPEDPYNNRSSLRSVRTLQSTASSRPASQATHHYVAAAPRPSPRFEYPAAPPALAMTRQTSNASSVETSTSAVSGSENWETYTDASDDDEPDVRMPYHGKVRTVKRDSPEDSAYEGAAKSFNRKVRAMGASDDGSEAAWSDVGETF
jgi:protein regulator of cytokinesis 1